MQIELEKKAYLNLRVDIDRLGGGAASRFGGAKAKMSGLVEGF